MTVLVQIMIFSPWQREREGEGILEAGKSNGGNMVYFRENAAEMGDKEQSVERCKHVKSQAITVYFRLGKLRRVSTFYICTHVVRYNRSRDGRGRKHSRNRWCTTTGPPQTLRRQAQRLSRFGGRAVRSGRLDAKEVDVVDGGAVGGRLKKVT
jgi:hypothetical protein